MLFLHFFFGNKIRSLVLDINFEITLRYPRGERFGWINYLGVFAIRTCVKESRLNEITKK